MRDRFYVFAFLGVLVITAISIAYMDGAIDQHLKEVSDIHADIAQEHAKATYWEGKYQALSHEADWLSVASAEAKFQGGRQ